VEKVGVIFHGPVGCAEESNDNAGDSAGKPGGKGDREEIKEGKGVFVDDEMVKEAGYGHEEQTDAEVEQFPLGSDVIKKPL
jgi:hypothetical protein